MHLHSRQQSEALHLWLIAGVITDTKHIKKQAWQEVARQQGFKEPTDHQLTLILDMRLERAITEVPA